MRTLLITTFCVASPLAAAPPTLTLLHPAGAQQGKTAEVTATGTFDPWPLSGWVSAKGIEVKPAKEKGKFSVTVAADVPAGVYWLRLFNAEGASELRPFIVGTLPEVLEAEPNDDPKKPQSLAGNCVVNGKLNPAGDVDHFAVELKKGQTLVASLEANSVLRSPIDATMQVLSADGFVLAENNDTHGLDPQVAFAVPKDGRYLVRVFAFPAQPDASIRFFGSEASVYRLTVTAAGFADYAFPLAVGLKNPGQVELRGWNVPEAAKKLAVKPDVVTDRFWVRHAEVANPVAVRVEPHPCVVKQGPGGRDNPQPLEAPVTVSGVLAVPNEPHVFEFPAAKGKPLLMQVEARALGSATDPVLRITDAAGKLISETDDTGGSPDPQVTFTAPADGRYRAEVRDIYDHGSTRHFYRLRILPPPADYTLIVAADRFTLAPGTPLEIPVTINCVNGYNHPIDITAELPDGVSAEPVKADAAAKSVKLKLTAKGLVSGPLRIIGTSPGVADSRRAATTPLAAFGTTTEFLWITAKANKK
jgi:hypothetical protein